MPTGVEVDGLKELRSALRKAADVESLAAIKAAHKAAGDHIVSHARGIASGVGRQAAKAAESVKATNTAGYAAVRIGGKGYEFAQGAEFGGKRAADRFRTGAGFLTAGARRKMRAQKRTQARGDLRQFMAYRGNGSTAGYFLWPSIRSETPNLIKQYGDAIEAALSE